MRLIDADEFDRFLAGHEFNAAMNECYDADKPFEPIDMLYTTTSFRDVMRHRPTIRPKRARWKLKECVEAWDVAGSKGWALKLQCTNCGFIHYFIESYMGYEFCPNCGAKMEADT